MIYFGLSFFLSLFLTLFVKTIAIRVNVVDYPDTHRKLHKQPVALLGGSAVFFAFWLVAGYLELFHPILGLNILAQKLWWVFIASVLLLFIGILDDRYNLSPQARFLLTCIACLVALIGGLGLNKITNPFGGYLNLQSIFFLPAILVFLWLMGMMYTTKVLDGLDGLSTGIAFIGAVMIFFLTNTARYYQPNVGLLALIFAGACLGFLIFNFYPAKIFLGESGSLFVGFILGVLSIIAGGKVATALLVMAVPILDFARVIYMRFRHHQPFFQGDREHLHYRLLDAGWGHRATVIFFYAISFLFGVTTLFLQSKFKLLTLCLLAIAMLAVGVWLTKKKK